MPRVWGGGLLSGFVRPYPPVHNDMATPRYLSIQQGKIIFPLYHHQEKPTIFNFQGWKILNVIHDKMKIITF